MPRDRKFPEKFPETYFLMGSQISSRISRNLRLGQNELLTGADVGDIGTISPAPRCKLHLGLKMRDNMELARCKS